MVDRVGWLLFAVLAVSAHSMEEVTRLGEEPTPAAAAGPDRAALAEHQQQHQRAQAHAAQAKAALDKALAASKPAEAKRLKAATDLAAAKSDRAVAKVEASMARMKQNEAIRKQDMEQLSAKAGVETEAMRNAIDYAGPADMEEARARAQHEAAQAAQALSSLNKEMLEDDTSTDEEQATSSNEELAKAKSAEKSAEHKEVEVEKASQLAIKVDREKLVLAEDEASQLKEEHEKALAERHEEEKAATKAAKAAEESESTLTGPAEELRKAEQKAKQVNDKLAQQTKQLGELNEEKHQASSHVMSLKSNEHKLLEKEKKQQNEIRAANRIIDRAKAKEQAAIQNAAVAKTKATQAARLEQVKADNVAKQAAVIQRGKTRVSQMKQKLQEAKVEAIEAGFEATNTKQDISATTEANLPEAKAEGLLAATVAKAQQALSDEDLKLKKSELVKSQEMRQSKVQELAKNVAQKESEKADAQYQKNKQEAAETKQALEAAEAEGASAAAKAQGFEDQIKDAEFKVAQAKRQAQVEAAFQKTKMLRVNKDKAAEQAAKSAVTDDLSHRKNAQLKLEHLHTALSHARKQEAAAREAAETLYMSNVESPNKDKVIATLAEAKFNVHKTERMIQKAQRKKASASARNVRLKMQAAQMGAQLAKDEEELSQIGAKKDAEVTEMKDAEAAASKAKEAGSSIIAEARQMDLKQRQQRLKLDQEEGSIAQARKVKAHADEAASAAKKKVADEQQMQEKNEDAISNLKMVAQQDKLALATAISKKQALGAVFKREGDAEAALQVEMAALKRATNREEAMEKAFEATEGKAKEMKAQVGVDSSFVKRAYAAQSKLASNESHEKKAHKLAADRANRAEKQLGKIKQRVQEMHNEESKLIGEGQTALTAEVSAKAKMSQVEAAARAAKNTATAAARAAQNAGPAELHIEKKQKKAQSDVLADKEHLRWTTKVANAQTELAKQELTVALKAAEAAKNRTSSEGKNVAFDASLREKANADLEIADQLTEATGKLVNNNNSGLVKAAQMAHETKVNKHTTQAQKATADFKEAAAAALNSQHKFDAADAESEMSLHAAADAAAGYGQADTAERVALEKLKSMLPAEEAQEADSAAAKARAAVATSPKSLEGSGEEEALWAEQNAKELEQAHMGAPKRASTSVATTLGESQAVNHERHTSQLGKMLQKAQLSLDVDDEEDAIDAANGIKVNLPNDKGGVMLSLEKTLNDAITSS